MVPPRHRSGSELSDAQELGLPPGREVISHVGLHVEPGGAARPYARPIYQSGADRLVGEGHPRHEEHQRDHDSPGHDRGTAGTIGSATPAERKSPTAQTRKTAKKGPAPSSKLMVESTPMVSPRTATETTGLSS